jgi:hypothetical protein
VDGDAPTALTAPLARRGVRGSIFPV